MKSNLGKLFCLVLTIPFHLMAASITPVMSPTPALPQPSCTGCPLSISGRVVDTTGNPIAGANVVISYNGVNHERITDPGGDYSLTISICGFPSISYKVSLVPYITQSVNYLEVCGRASHTFTLVKRYTLQGDVNNDSVVDVIDALMIAQYYGVSPANFHPENGDVNCDGSITIIDALMVAQYCVGLITAFAC